MSRTCRPTVSLPDALLAAWRLLPGHAAHEPAGSLATRLAAALEADIRAADVEPPPASPPTRTTAATQAPRRQPHGGRPHRQP